MNQRTFRFTIVLVTLLALIFGAQGVTPARSAADAAPLYAATTDGWWTWVDGSDTMGQNGTYGTEDVPDAANVPGARKGAVSWRDTSGNLWLFGGEGYGSSGFGRLNDLWKFNTANGQWTWVDGSTTVNQDGIYGTEDVPDAANVPGARQDAISWLDSSGNLWLFGGYGRDSASSLSDLNDLWKFDPSTGQWTWVDGSNVGNEQGIYGSEDVPAAGNVPGGRRGSVSWMDASGNLWLFGGNGWDSTNIFGYLNDLWKFNPSTGQWTWVDGSTIDNQYSVYGTEDVPDAANVPGARDGAVSWRDADGNLWLFGGVGYGPGFGNLNELWKFNPATGQWTWVDGSNIIVQNGIYGTEDIPAAANVPGARQRSVSWMDASGNLWLFGGAGKDSVGGSGSLNDLWKFDPVTGEWTWVDGSNLISQPGTYGTEGVPAVDNVPGARYGLASWRDAYGDLWIFGGYGYDSAGNEGRLNDLWKFSEPPPDSIPPVVTVPSDITVLQNAPAGAVVTFSATATDETSPANPAVTCVPPSGSTFPVGTTTVNCSAMDNAGNTGSNSFQVTVAEVPPAIFTSVGGYDGFLLELNQNSGTGGTGNSSGSTINIGDSLFKQQQLGLLHFDTSSLPDNAVVTGISIQMKLQGTGGTNPFTTHGSLLVDIASPFFGTLVNLQAADFQAASSISGVGAFNPVSLAGNWYNADLGDSAFPLLNLSGPTQFRIGFSLGDDNDSIADLLKFYSGNSLMTAYRPVLIVYYYIP